ncbi:uncharacterized protein PHACADRAFT_182611 [Phanerochaete carnosa HHB-10118-sp]|uniref:ASTRA-associated protein 1 n=1 Tax=Phanerochaete carnosa (strain HHB-10118-sp) TaxID=650164 RepID=K5WGL1_PHACS|nr:uncharacterized protein PHACADRAFT_182611 [Phanerochaete carnosa HHB-10118-sp]EKM58244.1 hypothetical protein PHACADRAFT_182611 [Phanerochaete carnosa HHB-10118-sp]
MPSSALPPPSAPTHLIRAHLTAANALHFSSDNERLYSGDAEGNVIITSTRSLRPLANWRAHTNSVLGIEEWEDNIITHGRDNKLHVWRLLLDPARKVGESATTPGLSKPELRYSMDVNALNYCRFSLLPLQDQTESGPVALLAVPNLIESALADVWELPAQKRLHAAIGKSGSAQLSDSDGREPINPIGIIMSMHLFNGPPSDESSKRQLRLLCGYENGSVTLRGYRHGEWRKPSVEGIDWDTLWSVKLHVESVMAMTVNRMNTLALSVSADHIVGRYDLDVASDGKDPERVADACTIYRTKNPGNGSVAIRDDGRVCAIGGWDGKIRLYSTKILKPLGTLDYHKKSCQAVTFARYQHEQPIPTDDADEEEGFSEDEKAGRRRWFAVGSQDNRVSVWSLISFEKT